LEKERKQQIVRAAIKRFSKHGLKKTTLEEVARDLRIGKATIYHYFSSKEELYFECVALEVRLFIEDIKMIFNNESIGINKRFLDYFGLKENTPEKYKLLYSFIFENLKGNLFEHEKELLARFFEEENSIIKLVLSSVYSNKPEPMPVNLVRFLITHSWALLFAENLTTTALQEQPNENSNKDLLVKALENLIT